MFLTVGVWSRRNAQALKSVTPVDVSGLAAGYQLAQGLVAEDGALAAPLTGRKCAWYDVRVEEEVRTRDTDGEYNYNRRTVREETSDKPIRIVDGGAVCFVDSDGATVFPTEWSEWHGADKMPADRDPERHPADTVPGGSGRMEVHGDPNRRFRYLERYIYPGDPVFALGLVGIKAGRAERPVHAGQAQGAQAVHDLDAQPRDDAVRERQGVARRLVAGTSSP